MLRTHCCGHIVAHDVSWATQTGKHLLRTQSVSKQNQKPFLCPGHKCCARRQTGKHSCRHQCVRNNVSSFARALTPRWHGQKQNFPCTFTEPTSRILCIDIMQTGAYLLYGKLFSTHAKVLDVSAAKRVHFKSILLSPGLGGLGTGC